MVDYDLINFLLKIGIPKYKRMRVLENTIGMSLSEYHELLKLWKEVDFIEFQINKIKKGG